MELALIAECPAQECPEIGKPKINIPSNLPFNIPSNPTKDLRVSQKFSIVF